MNLINTDLNHITYLITGLPDVLVTYAARWAFLEVPISLCNNIATRLDDLKDNLEEAFADRCHNISGIFATVQFKYSFLSFMVCIYVWYYLYTIWNIYYNCIVHYTIKKSIKNKSNPTWLDTKAQKAYWRFEIQIWDLNKNSKLKIWHSISRLINWIVGLKPLTYDIKLFEIKIIRTCSRQPINIIKT